MRATATQVPVRQTRGDDRQAPDSHGLGHLVLQVQCNRRQAKPGAGLRPSWAPEPAVLFILDLATTVWARTIVARMPVLSLPLDHYIADLDATQGRCSGGR